MFTAAAVVLLALVVVAAATTFFGSVEARTAAMQVVSLLTVLALVVVARALAEETFVHLALVVAVVSLVGGLLYARFLEHWL